MKIKIIAKSGKLADALGISQQRCAELDSIIRPMIESGRPLIEVISDLNQRPDITLEEFCNFLYAIGYFQGVRST